MWVVVGPGDTALVPSPSYPIHLYAPLFAGVDVRMVRLEGLGNDEADAGEAFFANLVEAWESAWPKPRVAILSFPHNPTTACIDLATMTRLVEFAREHGVLLVHDFAYSDTAFDGFRPPSILEVPGASEVAVELYTLTKSFSMAGWRVAFLVGNAEIVQGLTKLKSYLDYGTFEPIQIAAIVAMNEAPDYPKFVNETYQGRRYALCEGLARVGWDVPKPKGTMFVWAAIPEPDREDGLDRVRKVPRRRGRGGRVARGWVRPGRRGLCPLRPHRERAADRPGHPESPWGPQDLISRCGQSTEKGLNGLRPPQAAQSSKAWLAAWNAHDLERHSRPLLRRGRFASPLAAQLVPGSDGIVRGKPALPRVHREEGLRLIARSSFRGAGLPTSGSPAWSSTTRTRNGGLVKRGAHLRRRPRQRGLRDLPLLAVERVPARRR